MGRLGTVFAILALTCASQALAIDKRSDDIASGFELLTTYAGAAGSLYVAEARCGTGKEAEIRGDVYANASAYLKPERLTQFVQKTFDERVKRSSVNPYVEPCRLDYLQEYRQLVPRLLAKAKASFALARYPS